MVMTWTCTCVHLPSASHAVGTPAWHTDTGGNHDWVEVLTESGVWSFTGAAEYTEKVTRIQKVAVLLFSCIPHTDAVYSQSVAPLMIHCQQQRVSLSCRVSTAHGLCQSQHNTLCLGAG